MTGPRVGGVAVGTVSDLDDPNGEGRIKVDFPWLDGHNQSFWAPVATLMSGGSRGSWFMPEIGDEALVAFEHGHSDHPFIVGFTWNGAGQPPDDDNSPSVRRLRTVAGHELSFDDRSGQGKVTLHSNAGHELILDESSGNAKITLKTAAGNGVTIDDVNPSETVKVSTVAGTSITLGATGVDVTTPSQVSVTASSAQVTASMLNVNAPIVNCNGVLTAQTIISRTAVLSPAFAKNVTNIV